MRSPSRSRRTNIIILIVLLLVIVVLVGIIVSMLTASEPADVSNPSEVVAVTVSPTTIETFALPTTVVAPIEASATTSATATATATATVFGLPSFNNLTPTVTATVYIPHPLSISSESAEKGDYLTITGGVENFNYTLGPLANGTYAIGPNHKFIVYVTDAGVVYAAKAGNEYLFPVTNVKKLYSAISKNVNPFYELSFHYNGYAYFLIIYEGRFGQQNTVALPRSITE